MASSLDINACVSSYFEGTLNVHCYTSFTLTTLHCSKVSFLQCCHMKRYNKIFTILIEFNQWDYITHSDHDVCSFFHFSKSCQFIYIYIYAFSRRFYPKRLTVHSGYTFVLSVCVFPGNRTHNLCAANAMLYHWATGNLFKTMKRMMSTIVSFIFSVLQENTEALKTKMSELRLYCDLLHQQVSKIQETPQAETAAVSGVVRECSSWVNLYTYCTFQGHVCVCVCVCVYIYIYIYIYI